MGSYLVSDGYKTRCPSATRCFSFRVRSLHVFPHAEICIRRSDQARPCPRPPHFRLWEASSEARKGALPWTNGPAGVCMVPPAQQSLLSFSPPQSQGCSTRTRQQQPSPHPSQPPNSCLCKEIGSARSRGCLQYSCCTRRGRTFYSLYPMLGTLCGTKKASVLRAEGSSIGPHGTAKLTCYRHYSVKSVPFTSTVDINGPKNAPQAPR